MAMPAETAFWREMVDFLSSAHVCIHLFIYSTFMFGKYLECLRKTTSSLPAWEVIVQIATEQLHQECSRTMVTALSGWVIVT